MWSTLASNPSERTAFFALLDEYFAQDPSSCAPPHSAPAARTYPQKTTKTISTLTPMAPSPTLSARASASSTTLSNSLASSALKNPTLSNAAFKQAGFSPSQAKLASKFGAEHSEVLAPHLVSASKGALKTGWNNKDAVIAGGSNALGGGREKGAVPSGLTSSKGVFKAVTSIKGPMSKEDAKKNVFKESLATRTPISSYASSSSSSSNLPPPPIRTVVPVISGLGSAKALYDYPGTEADDLPMREGDTVTIIEHVSADWLKCRDSQGQEGLVPTAYVQQL